jgi:hypothetical protein
MRPGGPRTILLAEPFCLGFEHAAFNAALAQACLLAYPEDVCVFHGEAAHLASVADLMRTTSPELDRRITWKEIAVAGRGWSAWRQFAHTRSLIRSVSRGVDSGIRALLFTAARELDILALKELLFGRRFGAPVCAVLHGVLRTSLLSEQPKRFSSLRGLRFDFRLPHPEGLRYLALGEPILEELRELVPHAATHFRAIDLPYLWRAHEPPVQSFAGPRPCFGYLGLSATSGFEVFLEIVREVHRRGIAADFRMVGHVSAPAQRGRLAELGIDVPLSVLSNEEYFQRGRSIDVALWTIPRENYRLTASTSFLESLSIVRPGIHLRNPYLEYYFGRMGNIGYLCDTPEAIVRRIGELCADPPVREYAEQCRTILARRGMFHPAAVGARLREIISEMERKA